MNILTRFREAVTLSKVDREFIAEMRAALADGVITDYEAFWLQERHAQLGAGDAWQQSAGALFHESVKAALSKHGATDEAIAELHRIRAYLRVDDGHAASGDKLIRDQLNRKAEAKAVAEQASQRIQMLHDLEHGKHVEAVPFNLAVRKGEDVLWTVPATLYESKIVSRRYEGGSRGVSVRVMKGVSFRVGAQRGQLITDEAEVPVGDGEFVITTQRLIFAGAVKSFADLVSKLISINPYPDGLRYTVSSRAKPRLLKFHRREGDFCCAALNRAART
jgi:hypothetical protein